MFHALYSLPRYALKIENDFDRADFKSSIDENVWKGHGRAIYTEITKGRGKNKKERKELLKKKV